jgi:hypothetical protein
MNTDIINSTTVETLKMTNIERDDCAEKCAFARAVTSISNEIKSKVGFGVFSWVFGGAGSIIITLIILLFNMIGSINDKLDAVNTNITNLRVEVTEKTTRIETIQEIYNIKVDKLEQK